MEKRHKDILRPLVAELRRTLTGTADGSRRGDLDRALERLGIATDGAITPFDALPNPTPVERHARQVAEVELATVDAKERPAARAAFVERAAYGWVNRLLALRVLEARGLIDETLRGNPAYDGLSEALYVLRQSDPARASGPDGGWWAVIEDACATQAAALPGLFALDAPRTTGSSSALHDPAIALRPGATALVRCVELLGAPPAGTPKGQEDAALAEMDAAFADPDAIGWAYQFYQDEAKAQVYARLKAGKKVTTRDDIAAATQLFTEPYMVQWLLQNSLGRSYHEAYPQSALPATWAYYMRPERLDAPAFSTLERLTLLDPCVGSGHFVREAFDMFVAMYREQPPHLSATEIADCILAHHLYGIDIDPRAAQLAAFTLYARAWELVRDERRTQRRPGSGGYTPKAMNLAASPERIAPGALARHLQRHPEDRMLEPLLKGVFAVLERADMLGSLLRPREHLQAAIAELRKPHNLRLGTVEEQDLQAAIETVAHTDPTHLEEMLLDRVASGFAAEAHDIGDVAAALFGRAAERGVRLLQLLDRQYAVVVTNPPYMGSKNMDALLRGYTERHYTAGKRDLYAAFIMRCLELAASGGRVAMVTQQSWMFLGSFAGLRAVPEEELAKVCERGAFTGLLRETSLETLTHLGPNAFEEISGEVVQIALFVTSRRLPTPEHRMKALRLVGLRSVREKAAAVRRVAEGQAANMVLRPVQARFLPLPDAPLVYWLSDALIVLFKDGLRVRSACSVRKGLDTADNDRFTRTSWELGSSTHRWQAFPKGGGYQKWYGRSYHLVDWEHNGARVKAVGRGTPRNEIYYGRSGLTYTEFGRGSLGVRALREGEIFNTSSPGIIAHDGNAIPVLSGLLNSHIASFLIRTVQTNMQHLGEGYVASLPVMVSQAPRVAESAEFCMRAKILLAKADLLDKEFHGGEERTSLESTMAITSLLHSLEGIINRDAFELLNLRPSEVSQVTADLGTPAGWFPLVTGYAEIPSTSMGLLISGQTMEQLAALPQRPCTPDEKKQLKAKLRTLYEAGPGVSVADEVPDEPQQDKDDGGEVVMAGAYLPIPAETFLEELSQKLEVHPISVYWLLQEIRTEGARCKPEQQRLLEDRLSVIVVRLLGHRWLTQLEAGEPVSDWADPDGILPLVSGSAEAPLADRVRERLRAEDGDLGVQQAEALLAELTGQNLETWLRRSFFSRHMRQFKYRPIAWHLASTPAAEVARGKGSKGRGGTRQAPAFECLVYYHASGLGLLARLRTQYVEPLLRAERGRVDAVRQAGDDTAAAQATARAHELEDFMERLRGVEEHGFDTPNLEEALSSELLDRWSGDGILAPLKRDALLAQERAWAVDINDGVRVNIAPLQLAGVLASDVLKEADARKALADRARWRADERRWGREGVLPRCGWMAEDIPASPRWTERAPEREGEQRKLEQKRAEAMARLVRDDGGSE
jgi:hypothetical protein